MSISESVHAARPPSSMDLLLSRPDCHHNPDHPAYPTPRSTPPDLCDTTSHLSPRSRFSTSLDILLHPPLSSISTTNPTLSPSLRTPPPTLSTLPSTPLTPTTLPTELEKRSTHLTSIINARAWTHPDLTRWMYPNMKTSGLSGASEGSQGRREFLEVYRQYTERYVDFGVRAMRVCCWEVEGVGQGEGREEMGMEGGDPGRRGRTPGGPLGELEGSDSWSNERRMREDLAISRARVWILARIWGDKGNAIEREEKLEGEVSWRENVTVFTWERSVMDGEWRVVHVQGTPGVKQP